MTLIINITTPEGIVMAGDSRQSQRNTKQITRISTNSANKLINVNDRIIVGIAGLAFFADETGVQKNVSTYVQEFCNETDLEEITVNDLANKLHEFLNKKYPWERQLELSAQQLKIDTERNGAQLISTKKLKNAIEFKIKHPNGIVEGGHLNSEVINILVSGFNTDGTFETYELQSPGDVIKKRKNNEYGSTWIGQGDVVSRLILGYDSKMFGTPILKPIVSTQQNELINQLHGIEYNIQWGLMTLQDAVDLAAFLIKSTAMIQKYADGIHMDIGAIQGVGGPIDIAIITKDDGIKWINKKEVVYPESF